MRMSITVKVTTCHAFHCPGETGTPRETDPKSRHPSGMGLSKCSIESVGSSYVFYFVANSYAGTHHLVGWV